MIKIEITDINEIRAIQLKLLFEFNLFCKKNGLRFFLSNGSALGAVKYGGFIPWDDDIDVCMPRADFERLIDSFVCDSNCTLFSLKNEKYLFPFAKLSDNNTLLEEFNYCNGVKLGVNIDIFPLDYFGDSETDVDFLYKKMEKLRFKLNWAKYKPKRIGDLKVFAKWIFSLRYKIRGARFYCNKIDQIAKTSFNNSTYMGNVVWGFYKGGEFHHVDVFESYVDVDFEEKKYPVPIGYDQYLKRLYGNYLIDPPKEKQITHHNYRVFRGN